MKKDNSKHVSARILICMLWILITWAGTAVSRADETITDPAQAVSVQNTRSVVGVGNSHIYKSITAARTAAIADALQDALETAALSMLPTKSLTQGFDAFVGAVGGRRNEFIESYRILKENRVGNDYYVLVQSSLMMDRVKKSLADAGLIVQAGRLPSVLFMIAEKGVDDIGYSFWWTKGRLPFTGWPASTPIIQAFRDKGFTIIDPDSAMKENADAGKGLKLSAVLSDFDAITFAQRLGAEVVVVGTATARALPNELGENVRAYRGTINLRALRCDTGAQVASINDSTVITAEDPDAGSKNALSNAGISAGRKLVQLLYAKWVAVPASSGPIAITIVGHDILVKLEAMKKALADIPGLKSLIMSEMTPDRAVLSVDYTGSSTELADTLLMKGFSGFGIRITDVTAQGMTIELK